MATDKQYTCIYAACVIQQTEEKGCSIINRDLWTCRCEVRLDLYPDFVLLLFQGEVEHCLTQLRRWFDIRVEAKRFSAHRGEAHVVLLFSS